MRGGRRARRDVPAGSLVLGCDSVLELDGEALGKPGDPEGRRRWQAMRGRFGRAAQRATAAARRFAAPAGSPRRPGRPPLHFADVSDVEIDAYVATGEPLDVAGAFTIDGIGGAFVTGIEGDHHNVVGVSLPLLRELVLELGHGWPDLWALTR